MFVVFAQPSSFPTFATQSSLSHLHHLVQPIAGRAAAAARNMRMVTLAYSLAGDHGRFERRIFLSQMRELRGNMCVRILYIYNHRR